MRRPAASACWGRTPRASRRAVGGRIADVGGAKPVGGGGGEAVNVEVLNVVRRSERTFDLQWRETRFVNGQQAGAERWRALITVAHQPPRNEAELMRNPLGLKIEDVSWTPDAS